MCPAGVEVLDCRSFLCEDRSKCLEMEAVCDGRSDCKDGSDEANNCCGLMSYIYVSILIFLNFS